MTDPLDAPRSRAEQEQAESAQLYRLAAEQGVAGAQCRLGVMYADGQGVPRDDAEAVRWFRLAADQGDAEAQGGLGFAYGTGRGVEQDFATSYMWLTLAIATPHRPHTTRGDEVPRHDRGRDDLGPSRRSATPRSRVDTRLGAVGGTLTLRGLLAVPQPLRPCAGRPIKQVFFAHRILHDGTIGFTGRK